MLDARRGQVYAGAFRLAEGGAAVETLVPGAAWDPEEFEAARAEALARAGASPEDAVCLRDADEPQSAAHVARWALRFGAPMDFRALEPVYMRKAEAQRRLEERQAAAGRL
jgi:tRNA A37 threonylcarbamoyladenosine modification protein TsaB